MKTLLLLVLVSFIFANEYPPGNDVIVTTKAKWVDDLIVLARDRKSCYDNSYPHNVLYYEKATNTWYADCLNLEKALFNGRDIYDFTDGSAAYSLANTGDITEIQLIRRCTDVSSDFRNLKEGEPRILYMEGHIGAYLGKTVVYNNSRYNVVEATKSFGAKIAFSWVDRDGTRRDQKGGYPNGTWEMHGKPTRWVKF